VADAYATCEECHGFLIEHIRDETVILHLAEAASFTVIGHEPRTVLTSMLQAQEAFVHLCCSVPVLPENTYDATHPDHRPVHTNHIVRYAFKFTGIAS
jgi:hypothetical protein